MIDEAAGFDHGDLELGQLVPELEHGHAWLNAHFDRCSVPDEPSPRSGEGGGLRDITNHEQALSRLAGAAVMVPAAVPLPDFVGAEAAPSKY